MTDDSQPVSPGQRPPASAWLRAVFTLGPALAAGLRADAPVGAVARDGGLGLAVSLLLAGGLALSERFFAGRAARMIGTLAFAALLAVGSAAVGFAGCVPYPYVHTVTARPAAAVPGHAPAGGPTAASQPSPRTSVELRWWPMPYAYHDED